MRPLAILDTSVVILLLTRKADDSPEEVEAERRREATKEAISSLSRTMRFAIPTAVLAELGAHGPSRQVLRQIGAELGRFRLLPLSRDAAAVAADASLEALRARSPGDPRGAVKYDALILGTAVASGAAKIITENRRDFVGMLRRLGATSIEVLVPSDPPTASGAQANLYQIAPKKK